MILKNKVVSFGAYTALNSYLGIEVFQYTPRNKDSGVIKLRAYTPGHRLVESRIARLINYDSESRYFEFKYKGQTLILKLNH